MLAQAGASPGAPEWGRRRPRALAWVPPRSCARDRWGVSGRWRRPGPPRGRFRHAHQSVHEICMEYALIARAERTETSVKCRTCSPRPRRWPEPAIGVGSTACLTPKQMSAMRFAGARSPMPRWSAAGMTPAIVDRWCLQDAGARRDMPLSGWRALLLPREGVAAALGRAEAAAHERLGQLDRGAHAVDHRHAGPR